MIRYKGMSKSLKLQHSRLSEQVLEKLMDWIMDGKVHMGQKLVTDDIAQILGVSRMPVREAIKSLEKMGIVESIPYAGTRVVKLTKNDVHEIYIMRRALEPIAAYYACLKINDEQIAEIEEIQKRFEQEMLKEKPGAKQIYLLNREFHFALYSICGLNRICTWIKTLWDNLAFYKFIYGLTYVNDKVSNKNKINEHREYIDCLHARDENRLKMLLEANLERHDYDVASKVSSYVEDHMNEEKIV